MSSGVPRRILVVYVKLLLLERGVSMDRGIFSYLNPEGFSGAVGEFLRPCGEDNLPQEKRRKKTHTHT